VESAVKALVRTIEEKLCDKQSYNASCRFVETLNANELETLDSSNHELSVDFCSPVFFLILDHR